MQTIQKNKEYAIFVLTHYVLKSEKPLLSCYFDGNKNEDAAYLSVFDNNEIESFASFFCKKKYLCSSRQAISARSNDHFRSSKK
jgi:hypothetical protein